MMEMLGGWYIFEVFSGSCLVAHGDAGVDVFI